VVAGEADDDGTSPRERGSDVGANESAFVVAASEILHASSEAGLDKLFKTLGIADGIGMGKADGTGFQESGLHGESSDDRLGQVWGGGLD
jgi:hypothetical protein